MTCAEMLGMIGWSADPDTRVEGRTRKGRLCLRRPGHACRRRLLLLSCEGIRKSLGCLEVDGDYDRTHGIALDEVDSPVHHPEVTRLSIWLLDSQGVSRVGDEGLCHIERLFPIARGELQFDAHE